MCIVFDLWSAWVPAPVGNRITPQTSTRTRCPPRYSDRVTLARRVRPQTDKHNHPYTGHATGHAIITQDMIKTSLFLTKFNYSFANVHNTAGIDMAELNWQYRWVTGISNVQHICNMSAKNRCFRSTTTINLEPKLQNTIVFTETFKQA